MGEQVSRILVEPVEVGAAGALGLVEDIHGALDRLGLAAPRLQHGDGEATWALLTDAIRRGLDTWIGLEDTLYGPNGEQRGTRSRRLPAGCRYDRLGTQRRYALYRDQDLIFATERLVRSWTRPT
ncbi:MAG: hypothetical protein ACR2HO_06305 [Rubrobacteraceae bacterium]